MFYQYLSAEIDKLEKEQSTMSITTSPGEKVVFKYPKHGWDYDVINAANHLVFGDHYTVKYISVGGFVSYVELKEVPGIKFNTVQFMNMEENKNE